MDETKIAYEQWSVRAVNTRVYPILYQFVVQSIEYEQAKRYLMECAENGHKKIECCRYYLTPGLRCSYSRERCTYAHGLEDLAPFVQPTSWKQAGDLCEFYHRETLDGKQNTCPFGARCSKVHAISADAMRAGVFTLQDILEQCDHLYEKPHYKPRSVAKAERNARFPVRGTRGRPLVDTDWSFIRKPLKASRSPSETRSAERSLSPTDQSNSGMSEASSDSGLWSTTGPIPTLKYACDGNAALRSSWEQGDLNICAKNTEYAHAAFKSPVV